MNIDLKKLPKNGKKVNLMFKECFNNKLFEISFINGFLHKTKNKYLLNGHLSFKVNEYCDRCLELYTNEVSDNINLSFVISPYVTKTLEIKLSDEELDERLLLDNNLNLVKVLLEEAESLRPIKKLCSLDCKGLCEYCGVNKNIKDCSCNQNNKNSFSLGNIIKNR
ncbi:MAG: DUF177 domain-containing protein [Deferribacterota bacterium]|nr:DUF177 domain-containing protein [Deferribacterota bacterium]